MKTLLLLLVLIVLASCARYTHKYVFDVEYMNGDRDTVTHVSQWQQAAIYPCLYSGKGEAPCLVLYEGGHRVYYEIVACYTRKYGIIEHTITRKP